MGSEPGATRAGKRTWALLVLAVVDASLGVAHAFCPPQDVPNGPLEIIGGGWQESSPHSPREIHRLALCSTQAHDG